MTKLTRPLILSAIIVLILVSCSFPGTTQPKTKNPLLPDLPVLTLTITASPTVYDHVDQEITYSYTIKNTGATTLPSTQFTVSDNHIGAPLGTAFNCGAATSLTSGTSVSCNAPTTYKITAADLTPASVTNTATASGVGVASSAATSFTINKAVKALTLTTTPNPQTYNLAGQTITFTYVITNTGNVPLTDQFKVLDTLISPTAFNCGPANTTLTPSATPGATVTCNSTPYIITAGNMAAPSFSNNAKASGSGVESPVAAATITKGTVAQTNPNLVAGSTIRHQVVSGEWLIQIARCYGANYNSVRAANPQLSNPAEISPDTTINVPNIGSDGKIYGPPCVGTHTVQSGDTWNSIALKYNADPTVLQMVNSNTLTVGSVLKVPLNSAGGALAPVSTILTLTTMASPLTYDQVGQVITFTYILKNTGTSNLGPAQFTVSDSLIGAAPFNCGSATITLAPNATVTCTATYTITAADMTAVSVKNLATGSGSGASPSTSVSATVNKSIKALTLTTAANPITYNQAGQVITFTYVILNSGNITLGPAQFTVSDALFGATPINCGAATITLAPNATVTCTAAYTITAANMSTASVSNIATASGGGAGPTPSVSATINKQ
jgi:uncharacterized repeat protein (TIGR01451 family)